MKNLIIIGARGFGREVFWLAQNCEGYNEEFRVKGYLDDKADALDELWEGYPPILDSVEHYVPEPDDVFICALGSPVYRKKYADMILAKGGQFINLVEKQVSMHPSVKMGYGNIISNYTVLSCEVELGNLNVIHGWVVAGHDVKIGSCCFLGTRVFLGGEVRIEDFATLNPGCAIHPHVTVGENATVGSNSAVIIRVKPGTTVMGVPAKKVEY